MAGDEDGDLGEVEWLDGPRVPNEPGSGRRSRRGWYLLAVGALVVVVVVVLVLVLRHGGSPSAAPPPPTRAPRSITNLGHALLDVPVGWEVFARDSGAVYRIQLAVGRVTRTDLPPVSSGGGPVSFVVGPHEVIIRPWDNVTGYAVPDSGTPHRLTGALAAGGPVVSGPQPSKVWVGGGDMANPKAALVGMDGRPAGDSLPVNIGAGVADGQGNLLVELVGGTYQAGPGGLHRVTTGSVLAAGPTGWLAEECEARHRCTRVAIDRRDGSRRTLGPIVDSINVPRGVISPDGRLAALASPHSSNSTLHLLDLRSGADRRTTVVLNTIDDFTGASSMFWSPDGRWLFVRDVQGRVLVVDRTRHARPPARRGTAAGPPDRLARADEPLSPDRATCGGVRPPEVARCGRGVWRT